MSTLSGVLRCLVLLGLALAGCTLSGGSPSPTPSVGINVANATSLTVTVFVNDQQAASFAPGIAGFIPAGQVPAMPWTVVAKTTTGRVLTSMTVNPGDAVWTDGLQTGVTYRSVMARVDLSCGRLDMWAGTAPPMGPPPGSGSPGDCVP